MNNKKVAAAAAAATKQQPTLTYAEKLKQKEYEHETQAVLGLSINSTKNGLPNPSFEERTKAYLIKPEDEAY